MTPAMHKGLRGYKDEHGTWLPAVGTVLDVLCGPKSDWIDESALAEGSACHAATALYLKTGSFAGIPDRRQARVFPLLQWLINEGFKPLEVETTRASVRHGYAGTPDALLERSDGLWIADWKFAESLDLRRYPIQLTAYWKMAEKVKGLIVVQVTKAGEVKPKYLKSNPAEWAAFLGALSVLRWRLSH